MTLLAALFSFASFTGAQQPIGAVALGDLVQGLGVNTRVLVIGAHPDDEDTYLISWLARGRHVETAYLSLTRGEGGQNLIGNELGYALGQIRTEELLAARRVDGGRQFFTRAVDFGFSKSLAETAERWPRELILRDVVAVIRSFRPHVIVSVWAGTDADGHGHHQYSGVIAKEGFEVAGDSTRFRDVAGMPPAWSAVKLYRVARVRGGFSTAVNPDDSPGNVKINVGEYSPLFGRSYAGIAAHSRSQHLSQGMGMVLPLGTLWDGLTLDTARVAITRATDTSIFAGIDTTWARIAGALPSDHRPLIDSLLLVISGARRAFDASDPSRLVAPLSRVLVLARAGRQAGKCDVLPCGGVGGDLAASLSTTWRRAEEALVLAAGVTIDALAAREKVAARDSVAVTVSVYNHGRSIVELTDAEPIIQGSVGHLGLYASRAITRDSAVHLRGHVEMPGVTYPWWLVHGTDQKYAIYDLQDGRGQKRGRLPEEMLAGEDRVATAELMTGLRIDGTDLNLNVPIVHRYADPARGERRQPLVGVPRTSTALQSSVEYIRANRAVDRSIRVEITSAWSRPDTVFVQLPLPPGLRSDSATRRVVLPPFGKASVFFRIRGIVKQDEYLVFARVWSRVGVFREGFTDIRYDHIRPIRYFEAPEVNLSAVDVNIPANLEVAYVRGVGDNIPRMLEQLEIRSRTVAPDAIPTLDPAAYSTLVIGPRAFEASEVVAASARAIQDFARRGGTVVVQYSPNIVAPGLLPFPATFARPVDRVTDEAAVVVFLAPAHRVVNSPNTITAADFARWGQERGLYMPRTFDPQYKAIFEMHDQGEPSNSGGILVAPLGKGTYIYTSLSFFRQLPGGNPGAARLFVNLLSAGLRSPPTP